MRLPRVLISIPLIFSFASVAFGQEPKPIARAAVDIRATFPRFKALPDVATPLAVKTTDLPGHGLGFVFGAHLYPVRTRIFALGLGGELLSSRGRSHVEPTTVGGADGPAITTRFSSIAPQISLNFGKREGWSYVSGGLGSARFQTEREDRPVADANDRAKALNYGGGARWFAKEHLALSLDLRFYAISAQEETPTRPAVPRGRILVMSGGIAFK